MSDRTGWLAVTINANQRISMGRGTGRAFHTEAHHHVPGSVLRGAIAHSWLARGAATDDTFRDVFDRCLRFGPCFADGTSLRPLSVRSCKYRADSTHECRPGAGPGGSPRMSWDAAFPVPDDIDLPPEWDHPGGHWTGSKGDVVAAPGSRPPVTTVTSTAINHDTGTAADGQLFSRAAIEVGTILRGHITGRADVLDVLAASLADHDRLELGGRSSVLGAVRLAVQPENPPAAPTGPRVVLRTLAPSFLLDDAGRPSLNLEFELRRLGYQGTVEKVWSRPVTEGTGGYHAASRLPKPADVGLAAGTTAVLCPIPDDTAVLATVAGRGIGVRRPEGFGWVVFTGTPWQDPQPPSSSDGRGFSPQPGSDHAEYAELVESLRNARLDQVQRRWLGQRLGDGGGTATDVDAVLQQPGAGDLTSAHVAVVRRALTRDAEFRRRLADHLREEGHR